MGDLGLVLPSGIRGKFVALASKAAINCAPRAPQTVRTFRTKLGLSPKDEAPGFQSSPSVLFSSRFCA